MREEVEKGERKRERAGGKRNSEMERRGREVNDNKGTEKNRRTIFSLRAEFEELKNSECCKRHEGSVEERQQEECWKRRVSM